MAQDGARSIRIQEPQFPVERRNSRHTFRCRAAPDNLRSSFAQTVFRELYEILSDRRPFEGGDQASRLV